ncbi:MAG: pilin [Candidatus Paceibacterota bacterium]|jgi:ABC-type glucose/galactose transport system permease subunit
MKKLIASIVTLLPSVSFAQTNTITDVNSLSVKLMQIGNLVIYFLVALAVIYIVYNVVMYIVKGDNPEEKSKAGLNVLWGIVGLFIIVSIWGLVGILTNTFKTAPNTPVIPSLGSGTATGGIPAGGMQPPQVQ